MRANYKIKAHMRCPNCKGWGTVYKETGSYVEPPPSYNHGLPLGSWDMEKCLKCDGTGVSPEEVK